MQPRRAAWVIEWLLGQGVLGPTDVHSPVLARWEDLSLVHSEAWLEALTQAAPLAAVFGVDPAEIPVDALLATIRRAAGGTIGAARGALARTGPTLNLAGGFHHAAPDRGAGFCAVNDVAVAIAVLRAGGFDGSVAVLDLDAHQPDGTAACLGRNAWIGSISGSSFGELDGVDEIVLPHADDQTYLTALDSLLSRMPRAGLTFVLAGGDVLRGDPIGALSLTPEGARERDVRVHAALLGRASVWLPAGGYRDDSWRVLAGTALVLAGEPATRIPPDYDPIAAGFGAIFRQISPTELGDTEFSASDIDGSLGHSETGSRLLGFYTAAGVELGLARYGILAQLGRLGYHDFRVDLDQTDVGDRMRLFGWAKGFEQLLVEGIYERRPLPLPGGVARSVLYVHWLTLRHPAGAFGVLGRTALPGQEVPGLGMAQEAGAMLSRMAERLGLAGVAFRPAFYHVAYAARRRMRFVDAGRQGRFLAPVRDTADRPLLAVTVAISQGRATLNGEVYTWEADDMVDWLNAPVDDQHDIDVSAHAARFALR